MRISQISLLILLCALAIPDPVLAQVIANAPIRVSSGAGGVPPDGSSNNGAACVNAPIVAFDSQANNISPGDTDALDDVYYYRFDTAESGISSQSAAGVPGDGTAFFPSISPVAEDGTYIISFVTDSSNIGSDPLYADTNGMSDIYINVPIMNVVERMSVGTGMVEADGPSMSPSVTLVELPRRMLVTYQSDATNLATDGNPYTDIFLTTVNIGANGEVDLAQDLSTIRITEGPGGIDADGPSTAPRISGDGKFVVFQSNSTNLLSSGPTLPASQIYLYSVDDGTLSLISQASDGTPGNLPSSSPTISYNGRYILYATLANNIAGLAPNPGNILYVLYDADTGVSTPVNVAADGSPSNGINPSLFPPYAAITPDGRFVAFIDNGTNLVPGDTALFDKVFLRSMEDGALSLMTIGFDGTSVDGPSGLPLFSGDAFNSDTALLVFTSLAGNLDPSDLDIFTDVYAIPLQFPLPTLTPDTELEVPPDIEVTRSSVRLSLQEFGGASTASSFHLDDGTPLLLAATGDETVEYDVRVNRKTRKPSASDRIRRLTKRNELTVRNLASGTWTVKYRALIKRGTRTVGRTNFSPARKFEINRG